MFQKLRNIMDSAKHGVIYFSMGTSMDSEDMPDEIIQQLVNMFGGLKQTVIWKLEAGFSYLPSNVHIRKWISQQSVLCKSSCIVMRRIFFRDVVPMVFYGVGGKRHLMVSDHRCWWTHNNIKCK